MNVRSGCSVVSMRIIKRVSNNRLKSYYEDRQGLPAGFFCVLQELQPGYRSEQRDHGKCRPDDGKDSPNRGRNSAIAGNVDGITEKTTRIGEGMAR
jgi:hypothetical protein